MALTKVTGQVINSTTDLSVGVATVGGGTSTGDLYVVGVTTFASDVSIGGTLTYEDVTNVDAVGLITARKGITVTANGLYVNAGISTFNADVKVGTGITLSKDGDVFFTGIATGNGSGLTALNASNIASGTVPTARLGSGTASSSTFLRGDSTFAAVTSTTINNNTDNYVLTGTGTADTINGEANLTFDGNTLSHNVTANSHRIQTKATGDHYTELRFDSNRSSANNALAAMTYYWDGDQVADIVCNSGSDTTNKDDGWLQFRTSPSQGSISEAMRIKSDGQVLVNQTTGQGSTSKFEVTGTLNNSYPGYSYPIMVSDDAAYDSSAGPGGGVGFSFKQTSGGSYAQAGGIRGIKENTTDGNYASALVFYTRKNGAGTAERLRIDSSGNTNIVGVCTAASFAPSQGQTSHKNIAINGAMNVAQRGTSHTSDVQGYQTVDRFTVSWSGLDNVVEQHQVTLTSGAPYDLGFRHAWQLKNGDQTGGAGASDYIQAEYRMEAQDIAYSGWDYTSSSSYITLSFWLKTTVSQDFTVNLTTFDGTSKRYPMKTGTIAANTWTKIVKTIPGDSNITMNNDTGKGLSVMFYPYLGNNYVGGSSINAWSNASTPNFGGSSDTAWYTTNDATFEVTGFQIEVGQHVTPFEHRSYADELRRCQRYFWQVDDGNYRRVNGYKRHDNNCHWEIQCPVPMRVAPSPTLTDGGMFTNFQSTYTATQSSPTIGEWNLATGQGLLQCQSTWSTTHANIPSWESYAIEFSAEQ